MATEFLRYVEPYVDNFRLILERLRDPGDGVISLESTPQAVRLAEECLEYHPRISNNIYIIYYNLYIKTSDLILALEKLMRPFSPATASIVEVIRHEAELVEAMDLIARSVRELRRNVFNKLAETQSTPAPASPHAPGGGTPRTRHVS